MSASAVRPAERAKALGAYYTDGDIAAFLVRWAVRRHGDRVLDPAFGGGVFLQCACQRLSDLSGSPSQQVYGVEIEAPVHQATVRDLHRRWAVPDHNLLNADFFAVGGDRLPHMDVVLGNPPFIRYQRFAGEGRRQALTRAAERGVELSRLSSSWAPFVVHCCAMLRPGGRLAMVLPMELTHASYARPVLWHLAECFHRVWILSFRRKLFPDLSQDTVLLLAEDFGGGPGQVLLRDYEGPAELLSTPWEAARTRGEELVDHEAVCRGDARMVAYFLPRKARELYRQLAADGQTTRLGALGDVGIGYVTGANDFFHLSDREAAFWDVPDEFLRPAVLGGRELDGLRYTRDDWMRRSEGRLLLHIPPDAQVPAAVEQYLQQGRAAGVPEAYKCRTRRPWFSVPHVYEPSAFVSYMGGRSQRLVANDAGAVAPNSLHVLRLHPGAPLDAHSLACAWQTSLSRVSCEIEGHALGGGMLKLEPREAAGVLVPLAAAHGSDLTAELDGLVRAGRETEAQDLADEALLRRVLGLDAAECRVLKEAAETLWRRRYERGAAR